MLRIEHLKKNFKDAVALSNVDLTIKEGEIFGFVGPNGAGKTTTLKILAGLLMPDSGAVFLNEVNLLKNRDVLKKSIGYMPDFFGTYDNLKAIEYLEFYASTYGITDREAKNKGHELLERFHLERKASFYVDDLSRGEKQRLCLARSLVHDPKVIILDEPTAGLDPHTKLDLKHYLKALREENKTILVSSHILTELSEICTSIGILDHGEMLLQGSVGEIMAEVDSSNPLIITILGDTAPAVSVLKKNDFVKTVAVDESTIMVKFIGSQEEESLLLKELIEQGAKILSFRREQSNLESLFLKITEPYRTNES